MADEPLTKDEELEVVIQMMDGDAQGLVRLLTVYGPRVKWLLMRKLDGLLNEHDVDGIVNLAAHKAWTAIETYDDKKCRLGGWFYTIAHHCAVDVLRGEQRHQACPIEIEPPAPQVEDDDPEPSKDNPSVRELLECVEELGEKQRTIIKADLLANGEADAAVLAEKLGIPKQHVYSYRNKAREALLNRMMKRGHTADAIRRRR